MALTDYLARLGPQRLEGLLEARPDVLVEPVPRDFAELAARLVGVDSLGRALTRLDRDEMIVVRSIAMRGPAPVAVLAERFGAEVGLVAATLDGLCRRGLAWPTDAGPFAIAEALTGHFRAGLAGFRPLRVIAGQAYAEDLRAALSALGGPEGLTKVKTTDALEALLADPATVRAAVDRLSGRARRNLDLLLHGSYLSHGFRGPGADDPQVPLVRAGLLVAGPGSRAELPREVALVLTEGTTGGLSGPPRLPVVAAPQPAGRAPAESTLLALTALLDEAAAAPLTVLKKGGVGAREQRKLATRLGISDVALWIDLAAALGLLGRAVGGYATTDAYPEWREGPAVRRWAGAALAWFRLDHAPTSRHRPDRDVAPPLPLGFVDRMPRRALLTAAAGGRSLDAVHAGIGWYCPLYDSKFDADPEPDGEDEGALHLATGVDCARREAELLGLAAGERLTDLGELLVELAERPDAEDELARRAADLLPETTGRLVLQSDLTAVVSGQPSAAAARLLLTAAVPETRGAASTWRFGAASVRAALDAGWSAEALRAELVELSGAALPQPLDYLLSDVARRHGSVRVRSVAACVTGTEAEIAEVFATRALAGLGLRRIAPTVLVAQVGPERLLTALRGAGFSPMPEDDTGSVITAGRPAARRAPEPAGPGRAVRTGVPPAELAARLIEADGLVD